MEVGARADCGGATAEFVVLDDLTVAEAGTAEDGEGPGDAVGDALGMDEFVTGPGVVCGGARGDVDDGGTGGDDEDGGRGDDDDDDDDDNEDDDDDDDDDAEDVEDVDDDDDEDGGTGEDDDGGGTASVELLRTSLDLSSLSLPFLSFSEPRPRLAPKLGSKLGPRPGGILPLPFSLPSLSLPSFSLPSLPLPSFPLPSPSRFPC